MPVKGEVLEQLVATAVSDAAAGKVTPPVTPGDAWTPERLAWLRSFQLDRLAGLDGKLREVTWAVLADGCVVGGARLAGTDQAGELEVGLWLARWVRGRGFSRRALISLLARGFHAAG